MTETLILAISFCVDVFVLWVMLSTYSYLSPLRLFLILICTVKFFGFSVILALFNSGLYEGRSLGYGSIDDEVIYFNFAISIFYIFLYFDFRHFRTISNIQDEDNSRICIKMVENSFYKIAHISFVCICVFFAFYFKTLAAGLEREPLPYKLNGLVDSVYLFLMPLTIVFMNASIVRGMFLIAAVSFLGLLIFGSKFSFFFPVILGFFLYIGWMRPREIRLSGKSIFFGLFILGFYLLLNPYKLRDYVYQKSEKGYVERVIETVFDSVNSSNDFGTSLTMVFQALCDRFSGAFPFQWALHMSRLNGGFDPNVNERVNLFVGSDGYSLAIGHYGFFVVLLSSAWGGVLIGMAVIAVVYFLIKLVQSTIPKKFHCILIMAVVGMLPFIIDGQYDTSYFILRVLSMIFLSICVCLFLLEEDNRESKVRVSI